MCVLVSQPADPASPPQSVKQGPSYRGYKLRGRGGGQKATRPLVVWVWQTSNAIPAVSATTSWPLTAAATPASSGNTRPVGMAIGCVDAEFSPQPGVETGRSRAGMRSSPCCVLTMAGDERACNIIHILCCTYIYKRDSINKTNTQGYIYTVLYGCGYNDMYTLLLPLMATAARSRRRRLWRRTW